MNAQHKTSASQLLLAKKLVIPTIMLPLLMSFSSSCFVHKPKAFIPTGGQVCDQVIITGTFYQIGRLDGVWFNGTPAAASFVKPANAPREIHTTVPVGATTGSIRVKISTGGGVILGVIGTDHTFIEIFEVKGSPATPAINLLQAEPSTIREGQSSMIRWEVSPELTSLRLNGSNVLGLSSKSVAPASTTTYTLVATNQCLQTSRSTLLTVIQYPNLTSLNKTVFHPGELMIANGSGLLQTGNVSQLIFHDGTAVTDNTPSLTQLDGNVPPSFQSGNGNVRAKVGTDVSNMLTFTIEARQNGDFIDIKSQLGVSNKTCETKTMKIFFDPPGWPLPVLAVFAEGNTTLAQHNFTQGTIGGAAFSPKCNQANSLNFRSTLNRYDAVIERFSNDDIMQFPVKIIDGVETVPERFHLLFSPDDKIAIISGVPLTGPRKLAIKICDLAQKKDIGTTIFTDCTACNLTAKVIDGSKVELRLDGTIVGTYDIF